MTEPKFSTVVPAGWTIQYFEKPWGRGTRRWYEIDGSRVPSVTEVLGIIDDGKAGGVAWSAARIWLKGTCELLNVTGSDYTELLDPERLEADLKARKLLHTDVWGDKTDLGSTIHACLEALAADEVPALSTFADDERPYAKAVMDWWSDHDPKVIHTELLVGSRLHGVSGRFDLLYEDAQGQTVLADLKTAASVRPAYAIQLAGYAGCMEECGYGTPDRMEIVHVKPDASYSVVESHAKFEDFLAILDAHRAFHAVKADMKKAA